MGDFDFLREHGFGVVYGEDEVRKLIKTKGNNMNEVLENTTVETDSTATDILYVAEAPSIDVAAGEAQGGEVVDLVPVYVQEDPVTDAILV